MTIKQEMIRTLMGSPAIALSPMAGITDKPMRQLAKQFGATWTVSEMVTSDPSLQYTRKTLLRLDYEGEQGIRVVQIAGSDPQQMAQTAQYNVELGAEIIDINMGCPAKKVCNVLAGSALLQNEELVQNILQAVVSAVDVPVTLKTRLGWDDEHQNILNIAQMAQNAGIAALAIHGRTRTQMYRGEASYALIAKVKQYVDLPLWVNGDIDSPYKAKSVLEQTGADGVMIGRAAQGQPWLFADIREYLQSGQLSAPITFQAAVETVLHHLEMIYDLYGEHGVKIARKHIAWYLARLPESDEIKQQANRCESTAEQYRLLANFFKQYANQMPFWQRDY